MKKEYLNVYNCCGQYIVTKDNNKPAKLNCPRCGRELKTPDKLPKVLLITAR